MLSLPNSPRDRASRPSFSLLVPTLFTLLKQTLKTIKYLVKPLINSNAMSYFSRIADCILLDKDLSHPSDKNVLLFVNC